MAEHAHSTTPRRPLAAAIVAAAAVAFARPASSAILTIGRPQEDGADAELLALHPALVAAVDAVSATEIAEELPPGLPDADFDDWIDRTGEELDEVCCAIVGAPRAVTAAGRALKAAAAMHQLRFAYDGHDCWPGSGERLAWNVLSELAGDIYTPVFCPEHCRENCQPERA